MRRIAGVAALGVLGTLVLIKSTGAVDKVPQPDDGPAPATTAPAPPPPDVAPPKNHDDGAALAHPAPAATGHRMPTAILDADEQGPPGLMVPEMQVPNLRTDGALNPPGGRQEPPVSLEWVGPSNAQLGEPTEYALVARNTYNVPVQKVVVSVRLGAGITATEMQPDAARQGDVIIWQLDTLLPKQEKTVRVSLAAKVKKDFSVSAWVTFAGVSASAVHVHVHEPKLALKAAGPQKVMVGDTAAFTLSISNPGDGPAEQVKVHVVIADGLEHAAGKTVDLDLGSLGAGESRSLQMVCIAKGGGEQKCEAVVEARGGIHVQDSSSVVVLTPRLEMQLTGPGLRYVARNAIYNVRVTNQGEVPASNVTVSEVVPAAFKFVSASNGGTYNVLNRNLSWFLGELGPGQTRDVQFEVVCTTAGDHKHRVTAVSERGMRVEIERELATRVEDLSSLLLEVGVTDDPVEVSKDTTYEVIITNAGSKIETDLKLVCTIPDKMELRSVQGPARYHNEGNVLVFEPLEKLVPRSDAVFQIKVKTLAAGDVRFKSQVTSSSLAEPLIKIQSTRIYADQPPPR